MIPVFIGFVSGLFVILIVYLLKQFDKAVIYGLILTGIGFLYVGFTWSDTTALIINCGQAVFFLLMAAYGIKKDLYILAVGYFLHGTWDMIYNLFPGSSLIPPHYDLFCLSIDFTIGIYLIMIRYRKVKASVISSRD